jgi:hypothetical protein
LDDWTEPAEAPFVPVKGQRLRYVRRSLTAAHVAAIRDDGVHWVAPSLYMQVRAGQGTRRWLFRYSRNDTNQWMGLGSVDDKPFTEARDEAAMLRVLVKRSEDLTHLR